MYAPRVRRIAADSRNASERRSVLRAVVWEVALEIRLLAAQLVAERGRCLRTCATRILPLSLAWQAGRPRGGEFTGAVPLSSELFAERFSFGVVDVVDGEVVSGSRSQRARKLSHDPRPL